MKIKRQIRSLLLITWMSLFYTPAFPQQTAVTRSISADSLYNPKNAYMYLRGIERDESAGFNPFRWLSQKALFIPKQIQYGIRYASGYGFKLFNDPKFITNIENFFFNEEKTMGWYPTADVASGFRPRGGLSFFYIYKNWDAAIEGEYAGEAKYQVEGFVSHQIQRANQIWVVSLSGLRSYDDDHIYYGIGNFPDSDSRSHFLSNPASDHGVYFQQRWKVEFLIGMQPFPKWQFFLTHNYQKRVHKNAFDLEGTLVSEGDIMDSFDIQKLPGFQHPLTQFYNELSLRYDTREKDVYMSPGWMLESYLGFSHGIKQDDSRYLKMGLDVFANIPVIQQNRFIVPRLIFHKLENLDESIPVAFSDYPTQPLYRGVSKRKLLRIDKYSLLPSIEYQYPLSFNLGAHLFLDYLMVANSLTKLTFKNAPWAAGIGVDFHGLDGELARASIAYGSEGIDLALKIGITALLNGRSE
ncbi:hypothetical protein GF337_19575 [candidate division KSB1 bacterium]|nr:hypothetical protein [candidate division KSB1 bacterium]